MHPWKKYFVVGGALLATYAVSGATFAATKNFSDQGPLSFHQPELKAPLTEALSLEEARTRCLPDPLPGDRVKLVGASIDGKPFYACYEIDEYGSVFEANVIEGKEGLPVRDSQFLKRSGAWPWIGVVKKVSEVVLGAFALAGTLVFFFLYYRRLRPGQPTFPVKWWQTHGFMVTIGVVLPLLGWGLVAALRGVSRARKQRVVMQSIVVGGGIWLSGPWAFFSDHPEIWSFVFLSLLSYGYVFGLFAGRGWLKPEGFGVSEDVLLGETPVEEYARQASLPPLAAPSPPRQTAARSNQQKIEPSMFRVQKPNQLPSFREVGGMDNLKTELKETFGLMLAFAGEAERYRITWNGILLHGPPGVGKTFFAKAIAGEYGLNFIQVTTGDLVSAFRGESARNIAAAFATSAKNLPCVLFFDEFDSVAQRREDWPDQESRRTVNQLLQSLEEWRKVRELIIMGATNSLDQLDQAAIRPGRFDRHIRVDLPDSTARRAIFLAQLKDRPAHAALGLEELARVSEGLTPAAIGQAVEAAAIRAFRKAAGSGEVVHITMEDLLAGMEERGGRDRPTVEDWTWEKLILPEEVKRELQQLQLVVEDPDRARAFGVEPPSGVLLSGPPGTGKTTIAKVLAAQAKCSFYPVTSATITSKWLGESEQNIQRLFQRARDNRPSIIFIDEIDAIASQRGEWGAYDREINQLLAEMDGMAGQKGVLVIAATNRSDQLDPALLRGGRLSRKIEIPIPDKAARVDLIKLYSDKMPLVAVDLDRLGTMAEGMSGADIKALCQQAALQAMMRGQEGTAQVTEEDFRVALGERKEAVKDKEGFYL